MHLGSESSAKILLEKLPKVNINGQQPIATPANESTFKQFESATNKGGTGITDENNINGGLKSHQPPHPMMLPPGMPPVMPGKSNLARRSLSLYLCRKSI